MIMPDQAILVTGAAGFIGFHVAQRLLQSGHRVVGVDNLNAYYDPRLKAARLLANHDNLRLARAFAKNGLRARLRQPAALTISHLVLIQLRQQPNSFLASERRRRRRPLGQENINRIVIPGLPHR